jgi:hypothetical protein
LLHTSLYKSKKKKERHLSKPFQNTKAIAIFFVSALCITFVALKALMQLSKIKKELFIESESFSLESIKVIKWTLVTLSY